MKKASAEEIKRLARSSRIYLQEREIPAVVDSINEILNYVEILNKAPIADIHITDGMKNKNVFRSDIIEYFEVASILNNAPEKENNLFTVPTVIKKNK